MNKFILFLIIFQFHISYGQEFLNPVYSYFLDEEKGIPRKDLNDYYWSSTEVDSNGAWRQGFGSGNQSSYGKSDITVSVRAVRAF